MEQKDKKSKSKLNQSRVPVFGSLQGLCFCALLTAISIVLGKFLQIPNPFQEFIRISFENLPVIIAGFTLGPLAGAVVGAVADLIGCVLYGYTINPIITIGAVCIGLVSGIISNYLVKNPLILKTIASVIPAHLIGSVLIKSWGLAKWYMAKYNLGYWEFVAWRLLNYAFIATAECIIIYLLLKNKAFRNQVERMRKR